MADRCGRWCWRDCWRRSCGAGRCLWTVLGRWIERDWSETERKSPAGWRGLFIAWNEGLFFGFFVDVLDTRFVDEEVRAALARDLEAGPIVPFDDAVDFFAVLKDEDHGRFGLHLFLVVE